MRPDETRVRLAALRTLAAATRATPERETLRVYLAALVGWSTATLTEACRRLQTSAPCFPKVAELAEECRQVATRRRERPPRRFLMDPVPEPLSPDKHAEIMAQFKAVLARKVMPR